MTTSGPIYNASVLASGQTRQAVTVQSYTEHQTNRVSVGVLRGTKIDDSVRMKRGPGVAQAWGALAALARLTVTRWSLKRVM